MSDEAEAAGQKLGNLSGSARRLLDYVALLEEDARYAIIRRMARSPEPDMIADLEEVSNAGLIAVVAGEPNTYEFVDTAALEIVMAEMGEARLPKLRARANAARGRSAS